jgi:hypothetical protein
LKRLVSLRQFVLVALVSLLFASCTKEISPIGTTLLNPADLLSMGYTDTIQIKAYTIPDDSVYTLNLNYAQLGSMYDPIFGRTSATFYSQVILSVAGTRFGTNPVFDSAFLYLPYKAAYGDTLSNMKLHVYPLTESIIDSVHSYSNKTVSYDAENQLGEITFQPKPHDSVYYQGAKHAPMIRIPINRIFGDYMLAADTNMLNANSAFVSYFKGICIVAEPQNSTGKGCIVSVDLTSTNSYIKMYYRNETDTTVSYFELNTLCTHFQNYNHYGYADAIPALKQQMDGNISLGQDFLFAQGLGGLKIKIEFPYLKQGFDPAKTVLNDAQLILGNASTSKVFNSPAYLSLRSVGEAGTTNPTTIVDEADGAGYFDGTYNASSNSYRFRITRYIQQVLTGKINNNGLHLIIPGSGYNAARLVLNGTSSPQSDLKLYLRYTKLQ